MANVRYMGGPTATLGTKNITENGTYNAASDDLDGYSQVNVDVPEPEGSVSLSYTQNGLYEDVDVEQYATADITVNVPTVVTPTQQKEVIATTNQLNVTPDGGYVLDRVIVDPQRHLNTYTPAENVSNNDMGIIHNYRYVNTSGMIQPTGTLELDIDSNGEYTEDVTCKANVSITVDVPVSGTLGTKNITSNGTYTALDDNLDGYSEVDVNVPQNATLGIKTITNNGNYYATADGYDGFSRVDVNVAGSTLQANKNVTATTSQQIVTPDQGYDGLEQVTVNPQVHTQTYTPAQNTAANDMGAQNNYRYVNTSGMITPSGNKSITANGTGIDVSSYATASVAVPDPTLTGNATATDVKSGKTFYSNSLTKQTGTYSPTMTSVNLWTNSNPSSAMGSTDISIGNYRFSNYQYIEIVAVWQVGQLDYTSVIMRYEDFSRYYDRPVGVIGFRYTTSGNTRTRAFYPLSDDTIRIGNSYQQTSASQSASSSYIIPYKINGLRIV